MLDIIGMTGAGKLAPLIWAHTRAEDEESWLWVLTCFLDAFRGWPLLDRAVARDHSHRNGLILYCDLGLGLLTAMGVVFPNIHIGKCTEHRVVRFYCLPSGGTLLSRLLLPCAAEHPGQILVQDRVR